MTRRFICHFIQENAYEENTITLKSVYAIMLELEANLFWYWDVGAFVFAGDVTFFTFEPHISIKGSKYGFKKENIYYFDNGNLVEL